MHLFLLPRPACHRTHPLTLLRATISHPQSCRVPPPLRPCMARLALACLNLGGQDAPSSQAAWHGDPSVIFSALAKGSTGARSSSFQGLPQRRRWMHLIRPMAGQDSRPRRWEAWLGACRNSRDPERLFFFFLAGGRVLFTCLVRLCFYFYSLIPYHAK